MGQRIVLQNPTAREFNVGDGVSQDVFGNTVLFELKKPTGEDIPSEDRPLFRALRTKVPVKGLEAILRTKDKRDFPILASASPILGPDGEIHGAVGIFNDITHLKQLERLREEWTSVVAHDLRQPISVIAMASDLIKDEKHKLSADQWEAVNIITANTAKLNHMIQDLLDASLIESHRLKVDLSKTELTEFLKRTIEHFSKTVPDRQFLIKSEKRRNHHALLDKMRMEQVMHNLLSNAVKYSNPAMPIEIEWGRVANEFHISISNYGTGLTENQINHLFQRFYRAPGTSKLANGIGLGLYITKGLIESHGGRIWVQNVPNHRTTFAFSLPIFQECQDSAAQSKKQVVNAV